MLTARVLAILLSLIVSASATASGLPRVSAKLLPSDRPQAFGTSVALSGHRALVGAPESSGGTIPGSAYVFDFNGSHWAESAKLVASDGQPNDYFGKAVAVSGDLVAVAAPSADNSRGYVYVFRFDGTSWTNEAKLSASDGAQLDQFGASLAAFEDTILVGAPGNTERGLGAGAAYAYRFDGSSWTEAKILASGTTASHQFGASVGLSADAAVIGAPGGKAAYVFRYDETGWIEQFNLGWLISAPSAFGSSVAISVDRVLVPARISSSFPPSSNRLLVYRFDGSSWSEEARLAASFSSRVSLSESVAAAAVAGQVRLYARTDATWEAEAVLTSGSSDGLGSSVAASVDTLLLGAPSDAELGSGIGAAFAYDVTDFDGDGLLALVDTCPVVSDPSQPDTDQNGLGDLCNEAEDGDGDEWADLLDNSPDLFNPGQEDRDADGVGDLTDPFPDDPRTEQAVAHLYETQMSRDADVDQLQSDVNQLFFSSQEHGAMIDSLLARIEALQSQVQALEDRIAVIESPDCRDGIDNDGDGRIDHPADRQCLSPDDPSE